MAEDEKPAKKGGNKVVIIAVSVVMLLTGGFFGLKMRGGGGAKPNELKMGETFPIDEFLTNVNGADGKYLRAKISVECQEGFSKDALDKHMDAVEDAIVGVLRQQTMDDLKTSSTDKLKKELADAANTAYFQATGVKPPAPDPTVHKDWDSQTGPILKVLFTSFAFQ